MTLPPPIWRHQSFGDEGESFTMDCSAYCDVRGLGLNMKLHRGLLMMTDPEAWSRRLPDYQTKKHRIRRRERRRRRRTRRTLKEVTDTMRSNPAIVTGKQWHEGRRIMDLLRACGYSWTQISRAAGTDNKGWAATAYDNKHMFERDHLDALKDELGKLPEAEVDSAIRTVDGITAVHEDEEDGARVNRAKAIIDELRGAFGMTWAEVADVFEYGGSSSPQNVYYRNTDPGADRLEKAEANLAALREDPEAWADDEPDPLAGASERHLDRMKAPAPPEDAEPAPTPPARPEDPYAWLDDVQEGLLDLAARVERARNNAPNILRSPYDTVIGRLTALAEELDR